MQSKNTLLEDQIRFWIRIYLPLPLSGAIILGLDPEVPDPGSGSTTHLDYTMYIQDPPHINTKRFKKIFN
jgi:hypothetical protein